MLTQLIEDRIYFKDHMNSWEQAIKTASQPLLEEKFIKEQYIDAMIENVNQNGAYMIIVPGFAMPHARPERGAIKTGMSVMHLEQPVVFPDEQEVKVLLVLAAADANVHLDAMADLAEILIDDDKMKQLFDAKETSQIKKVFNLNYSRLRRVSD